jgi:hypothetical protein
MSKRVEIVLMHIEQVLDLNHKIVLLHIEQVLNLIHSKNAKGEQ